ncbi:family 43 glycosylhydrolase [Vibrio mangrovi]|uniref:Extracellular exo-alpha-(1->5)-L-arabinofuranosidase n=1 Tax=Vibrio mangrovi TaxID=474394 RepID=A0A1Y6ITF8_9VIBR|nr:family 43 glycosylhydrolase [Vibrio mangrovi]MDW6004626.1 family 43 glycosylhydrolase [Vibrio mangrovi]SMS00916.1 Extracellular exo-alpha-(1->5)-L-arabinofuranosidase precursor [Vibrio mangrovi]
MFNYLNLRCLSRRLFVCLSLGILSVVGQVSFAASTTFTNPIYENGADPWLMYYDGNYYSVTTTWSSQLAMRKSPTLAGLKDATPVNVWSETNKDSCCNFWAFEFHHLNGPNGWRWYVLYTSGQDGNYDHQHNSVLESVGDDPMGPYQYKGAPLGGTYNIDGSYITINNQLYFMYSQWNGDEQRLYIARMSNPWTMSGEPSILSRPLKSWERMGNNVNEGPEPLIHNGHVYVVYSASFCATSSYKLALLELTGSNPLDPNAWTKSNQPLFESANGVYGPGHNGFFKSPDGTEDWLVYHGNAHENDGCSTLRSMRAQPFTWNADGTPNFGRPVAAGQQVKVPSGENGPLTVTPQAPMMNLNHYTGSAANGSLRLESSTPVILDQLVNGNVRFANESGRFLSDAVCHGSQGFLPWENQDCQRWSFSSASDGLLAITNRASNQTYRDRWGLSPVNEVAIVSAQSGRVLTATSTSTEQREWSGAASQKWRLQPQQDGSVTIRAASQSACLNVSGNNTVFGNCSGDDSHWYLRPRTEGGYRLVAKGNNMVMDVTNCALNDGASVGVYNDLDNICQRFYLRNTGDSSGVINSTINGTYRITPLHSDKSLDITNCATADGTNVRQWSWLNNDCQKFAITNVDGIWHRISPLNAPNQALDVYNGYRTSNANIAIYPYRSAANQQFRFQAAGSGKWRIINRNSGLCLNVVDSSSDDGANVVQYRCTPGAQNQMFRLSRE